MKTFFFKLCIHLQQFLGKTKRGVARPYTLSCTYLYMGTARALHDTLDALTRLSHGACGRPASALSLRGPPNQTLSARPLFVVLAWFCQGFVLFCGLWHACGRAQEPTLTHHGNGLQKILSVERVLSLTVCDD